MHIGIDGDTIYIEVKPDKESLIRRLADIEVDANKLARDAHALLCDLQAVPATEKPGTGESADPR